MENLLRATVTVIALPFLSTAAMAATTTKATVNGMVCAFCAQGIEKRLAKLPAAKAVYVDLKQRVVAVEAKEGMQLDDNAVKTEIVDAGYDVVKLEQVPLSVAELRQQMSDGAAK